MVAGPQQLSLDAAALAPGVYSLVAAARRR